MIEDDFTPPIDKAEYGEHGEPMTPGKLRVIARWLDDYDELARHIQRVFGWDENDGRYWDPGTGLQDDLRRWADELEGT